MRLSDVTIPLLALLLCGGSSSWATDYLYTPQPVTSEAGEGVLVREVTVKKGNTLSGISKQYSGRGYYYPQILLFNTISNPHRIHPGQVVRVPISRKADKQLTETTPSHTKRRHQAYRTTTAAETPPRAALKTTPQAIAPQAEKHAYDRALTPLKKGDCTAAIKLLDDFISRYPSSALLPEATLNRAECYLKLSAK